MTSRNWLQHCSRSPASWNPLPSPIIKECTDLLLPTITNIVNLSLRDGCMPTCLKTAVLSPLLKRPDADFLQFKNFRPHLELEGAIEDY